MQRILVPLDGSALAEGAIATALEMARPGLATLMLVRAAEAHTFPGADPTDAQIAGLGRLILGSVAESVLRGTTTPILLRRASEAPVEAPKGTGQARPTKETSNV